MIDATGRIGAALLCAAALTVPLSAQPVGTVFTYQGRLADGAAPATGPFDLRFVLYDAAAGGSQVGPTVVRDDVAVVAGLFTVTLDFGAAAFGTTARFIEIGVRPGASTGVFTVVNPRQTLTPSPYSIRSQTSTAADGLSAACVGCVSDSNITSLSGSKVSGLIPVASVPAGSPSYIHNSGVLQSADFNIEGDGVAEIFSARSQFNIGNERVLTAVAGSASTFAGVDAGTSSTGMSNSFFGAFAGEGNTTGERNSFFGRDAGQLGMLAHENAYFGYRAGRSATGGFNTFLGASAGGTTTSGGDNTFVGHFAGGANTTGQSNTFVGSSAGTIHTMGAANTFVGRRAGFSSSEGSFNTLVGAASNVSAGSNLSHATAIGAEATVSSNNTIALGRSDGSDRVLVYGVLDLGTLGVAGGDPVCRNGSGHLAACSSSLRYKTNVDPFVGGLDVVRRLRPITFDWKDGGRRDLGFAAEEVEQVEPLLATYDDGGAIEGVKYGQVTTVLVNAVKEQQAQIEAQRRRIDALERLVCRLSPEAGCQ